MPPVPAMLRAPSRALPAPRRGPARAIVLALLLAGALAWPARDPAPDPAIDAFLAAVARDPLVLAAVAAQNAALAGQPDSEIAALDAQWTAEAARGGGPLVDAVLAMPASRRLAALVAGSGVARAAIVMDDRGRNAAVSFATTDYLQGDEAKWRETFAKPPGTRHAGRPEQGQFGEAAVCWLSEGIADPATGAAIGAVSVAVDAGRVCGR